MPLDDRQTRLFAEMGFLRLGPLAMPEELAWLREVYDRVVVAARGYTPARLANPPPDPEHEADRGSVLTIVSPEAMAPELATAGFVANALAAAARLLACAPAEIAHGFRFFLKPGYHGATAWHQDAAYRPPPHEGLSVWMPLDDATPETSCMHYLAGTHLEPDVRPHRFHERHMVIDHVDASDAVACPIPAGHAIAHHTRTLHYTGPNRTAGPRRAVVVVCARREPQRTPP
jgi:ectoine hydroxylase-related dioxygenase (phytanoyl-CoA dioxygenase family)